MNAETSGSVTFETKCWEGDWEFLLPGGRLRAMIERNCHPFPVRRLLINNVNNYGAVCRAADRLVAKDIITEFLIVRDLEQEALDHFGLFKEDLGAGYYYSIAELVGLYVCDTEYLLHYSSDSGPAHRTNWIPLAIATMLETPEAVVANLTWNGNFKEASKESFSQTKDFFLAYGFSDQCYLVRTDQFRQRIYGEYNAASERYPAYGGELFEKRVDAWMRNNDRCRLTFKHSSYHHRNFPKKYWQKRLLLLIDQIKHWKS